MDDFQLMYKLAKDEPHNYLNCSYDIEDLRIVDFRETNGEIIRTPHYIKYFKKPHPGQYPLDLTDGFENFVFRNDFNVRLSFVEKYLLESDDYFEMPGDSATVKICSHRSVLFRIMGLPYQKLGADFGSFSFVVSKFKNFTFLALNKHYSHQGEVPKQATFAFKLKQFIFSDTFDEQPKTDSPVNENEQIFCVYRAKLKAFDLLYSAELDGIMPDKELNDFTDMNKLNECRFVRSKLLRDRGYSWCFDPKILDTWSQAYLSKSDVYVALRDYDGFVRKPIEYAPLEFLQHNKKWKPNVCLGFLHELLHLILKTMASVDCPYTVYRFMYSSVDGTIAYAIHEGKNKHSFLSNEIIQKIQAL